MQKTNLAAYNNYPYHPGGNAFKRSLWYYTSLLFFRSGLFPVSAFMVFLLRCFGAKMGKNIIIKPFVNIKYPWLLSAGDNTWIGEGVWIDNIAMVTLGKNVCLSQGAMLQTGSHNYKKSTFDLITGAITIEDGAWICAGAIVTAGVTVASHAVLAAGSVAGKNIEPYAIYKGNPAVKVRERVIT